MSITDLSESGLSVDPIAASLMPAATPHHR
jgi:hypothetical protein